MTEPFDYSQTLFLPKTDFPMRAGLPKKEPEILKSWDEQNLYKKLREDAAGRPRYILHDGPPYANGHLHIGHALNKTLKDMVTRSKQMAGYDSNYVPGWDCHGLPIEWKVEEDLRAKGKSKDDLDTVELRTLCRAFADKWIKVQAEEFRRLGVEGDFEKPYLTMSFDAEATIAEELMKFAMDGQLYRGSKPVMWSVVERTALAEAEIEYQDYESDTIWVKFAVAGGAGDLANANILIWTTTPWTIPGNRAVCYSPRIAYGLYEVTAAENDFGPQAGETFIVADALVASVTAQAKVEAKKLRTVEADELSALSLQHPLHGSGGGYTFPVPLLPGDHVTDDAGTGFVHTAPGHGREDFDAWMEYATSLRQRGIDTAIPFTVDDAGYYTSDAPGFGPDAESGAARVIDDKGKKGDANKRVIAALIEHDKLFARGRLKHTYPHSWRSKKPVIFRNTPQWFVYMDEPIEGAEGDTLRKRALDAIDATTFYPAQGQNRLRAMIENRPDWVLSRQRAWGVPITVFTHKETGEILRDPDVNARIVEAFHAEGADAWFKEGAKARFLGNGYDADVWEQVTDILDVWFDSGSTHAYVLEKREDLSTHRQVDGGRDRVMYLEGSDQHRGWFHSSLLESCGTRGRAPYDDVLTHGFTMAEDGRKMSKSLNNQVFPQDVISQYGADILRAWVASVDYSDDQRLGPEIIKTVVDSYRKLRNTLRWALGSVAHYDRDRDYMPGFEMPELERYMLHRLTTVDATVREAYERFDFQRVFQTVFTFSTVDLSAFYFDIRKDALYCDAPSALRRRACLTVLDVTLDAITKWLAPLLPFTMEEVWRARHGEAAGSVHLQQYHDIPADWRDEALAARWKTIRQVRRVVTGALEIERREKRIGSSLEAAPAIYIADDDLFAVVQDVDWAEVAIASQASIHQGAAPDGAFHLDDVHGVGVVPSTAQGRKCARSWKILPEVGSDPDFPDVTLRDADALRELGYSKAA
ncbi:MAG: isoleucine--tRNA ligase [Devosiaceae bacterium]|nr:isoleucine--tRNA ligase [Devosiaceae bacterium MH13]